MAVEKPCTVWRQRQKVSIDSVTVAGRSCAFRGDACMFIKVLLKPIFQKICYHTTDRTHLHTTQVQLLFFSNMKWADSLIIVWRSVTCQGDSSRFGDCVVDSRLYIGLYVGCRWSQPFCTSASHIHSLEMQIPGSQPRHAK